MLPRGPDLGTPRTAVTRKAHGCGTKTVSHVRENGRKCQEDHPTAASLGQREISRGRESQNLSFGKALYPHQSLPDRESGLSTRGR